MKTSIVLRDEISHEDGRKKMQHYTLEVDSDDTILSVMLQFEELTGYPPVVQKFVFRKKYFHPDKKCFHHDTPGTLAENELVPTSTFPVPPISVVVHYSGRDKLVKETLADLGLSVGGDMFPNYSEMVQLFRNRDKKMLIYLMDHIRRDGGRMKMALVVEAGDTVASLKEKVRLRRFYPLAMQRLMVGDPADPCTDKPMDRLDATLAEYNVKNDSVIKLFMSRPFAVEVDRMERGKAFAHPPRNRKPCLRSA